MRTSLAPIAPEAGKHEWRALQTLIDKVASPRRFVVTLLGGFTAFALILAALGIYALVSYGVNFAVSVRLPVPRTLPPLGV